MAQIDHPGFIAYRPRLIVGALRISSITKNVEKKDGRAAIKPGYTIADRAGHSQKVNNEFVEQHGPQSGGYLVLYENEELSYFPAATFNDAVRL